MAHGKETPNKMWYTYFRVNFTKLPVHKTATFWSLVLLWLLFAIYSFEKLQIFNNINLLTMARSMSSDNYSWFNIHNLTHRLTCSKKVLELFLSYLHRIQLLYYSFLVYLYSSQGFWHFTIGWRFLKLIWRFYEIGGQFLLNFFSFAGNLLL